MPSSAWCWRLAARSALLGLLLGGLAPALPQTQAEEGTEAGVKAAYLYKFLSYVEWPPSAYASPEAAHVIGLVGADAVAADLDQMLPGRRLNGRALVARKLRPGDSVDGLHVLYLGRDVPPARWLQIVASRPVLVVTDSPTGAPDGSALNFVLVARRVRFEAAPQAAERVGLKLSARLLAVAERVAP